MEHNAEAFGRHLSLERGLSRNTCLAYAGDLKAFLGYCSAAGLDPLKADARAVEEYLWKLKTGGLASSSVFRKTESLRAYYRFLMLEGKISSDPTRNFRAPRTARKIPRFLSGPDMEKLLSFPAGGNFALARTVTAVELLYACGLRVSELLGLRLEAVNLPQGWLRVFGKGAKERLVPMHSAAVERLRGYLDRRQARFGASSAGGEIFVNRSGKKLSRVQLWKDLLRLGKKAGVAVHPHMFRHTFASHLVQAGADLRAVQEMLGHASLNTTQIYSHVEKSGVKAAHGKFHPDKI